MARRKLHGTVIVTYRCNARCNMCNCHKHPTDPKEEITLETIRKLPEMALANITGGEPFIREDIGDIVGELYKKSNRVVITSNGFFADRIINLCKQFPKLGIRISIEGMQETNDAIRGIPEGFNRGYEALRTLAAMRHPDAGFSMTIQDANADELLPLYHISDKMKMEFSVAAVHNSFHFKTEDNKIDNKEKVTKNIEKLINEQLRSSSPKKWFRAYFNHGLIGYVNGRGRLLPCGMSGNVFFVDPYSDVLPCNGMAEKAVMGNLGKQDWDELWNSGQAQSVREQVSRCRRNCWMVCNTAPAMRKYIWIPAWWVVKHKIFKTGRYTAPQCGITEPATIYRDRSL